MGSRIRVNELQSLNGDRVVNVDDIVDEFGDGVVTTETGEQSLSDALNARAVKGDIGNYPVDTNTGAQSLSEALNDRVSSSDFRMDSEADYVLSVPSEYPDIKSAVDALKYKNLPVGARARIEVAEGSYSGAGWNVTTTIDHQQSAVIDIVGLGTGATITTDLNAVASVSNYPAPLKPFFHVRAPMGVINNLVVQGTSTGGNAVGGLVVRSKGWCLTNSKYKFTSTDDSTNTFGIAAVYGGFVDCSSADVSGNGNRDEFDAGGSLEGQYGGDYGRGYGLFVGQVSTAQASGITASRCGNYGIAAYVGSIINANGATATGCGHHNVLANRSSIVNAEDGTFHSCLDDNGVAIYNSLLTLNGSDLHGATTHGIVATSCSRIEAEGCDISDCDDDNVVANQASMINVGGSDCSGSGQDNLSSLRGSTINAEGADCRNAGRKAALAFEGASINMNDADARNAGERGIEATRGSRINARNVNCSGASSDDIDLFGGSWINFESGTGTPGGSVNVNGISSKGIFFR